ncbi:hypothetical protein FA15DRAFT_684709 [Coprinopsis marcescibilis]|uniref:Yeast cell wall synthesis Kre9/Knh1-like N-terminal domain-containing protein n=1 Tax=Coprinopsis marcescibilis TaxID=230819 RepID=A0A5C3LC51_COPMA|nr:hypothetical protein FA15DRAFT_684709 [Coprinopsis marcescibilis]
MLAKTLILLAVGTAQVFATVFITTPTAVTTFAGGQTATIVWEENGEEPSLADFGPARISIYVGNPQQQTELQVISEDTDVSEETSIEFIVDATIGPNSDEYFIRFDSLEARNPAEPRFPAQAFSAKFNLNSMTGEFTPEIISQIAGQPSSTRSGGPSTRPGPTTNGPRPTSSRPTSTTPSNTNTPGQSTRSPAPSNTNAAGSGAVANAVGWVGVLLGGLVGAVAV